MSFSLKNQRCQMGKISNNLEMHGEQEVIAFDVPFTTEIRKRQINALLGDQADERLFNSVADVLQPHDLFTRCAPLAVLERFDRGKALVALSDKRSFEFEEVLISKINLAPRTGGVAELSFTMRVRPTSNAEMGGLLEWQRREVSVDVTGAKTAVKKSLAQQELPLTVEDGEGAGQTPRPPDGELEQRPH